MTPKVLITGGAGYVGSLLTPTLLDLGYEVVVYDVMYFGSRHLPMENPLPTVVESDVYDSDRFRQACEGVDAVIPSTSHVSRTIRALSSTTRCLPPSTTIASSRW